MNPAPDSQSLKAGQIQARAHERSLELEHNSFLGALPLLRLDAELQAEESQSPRPFLHPMRTLGGMLASDFAPPDHAWHHGLSMTCAALKRGGETFNFWGGPTFERGQGYVLRPNHGRQESASRAIPFSTMAGDSALIRQRLRWSVGEEVLIEEERTLQVLVLPHERAWSLIWSSSLKNVCGQALLWGSPTTEGRDNAGYGGLFWRGPRGLKQSHVAFVPRDASPSTCSWLSRDEDIMGRPMQSGEDLLFRARGESGSFVLACAPMWARDAEDSSPNLGWQPRWFARTSVPMVAWAFSFAEERVHEAGQTWLLEHSLALLDLGEGEDFDQERLKRIWGAQHRALDGFGS